MEYKIKPKELSFFSIFFVVMLWNVLADYLGSSILLFLIVLLFGTGLTSLRFSFEIHENHLVYRTFLLNKSIIKKEIYPPQINQLKFTRVGWAKKAAIIKTDKALNVRLAVLTPKTAYDHLMEFAENHDIKVLKTKDYLTLERMR
ncbi:hypothetical protein [Halobacillus campisalis]|uniref:PH domain-containing protein n=1 Tax=Halobacillus campisalis TaxID=435909 RepID=A0ABW2K696_9BACI|nr:hypothetical protein [Halobacillus campisalis]